MKRLVLVVGVIIAMVASVSVTNAQVVVTVKPKRPTVVIVKPNKVKRGHIWVDGHWRWNKKTKSYAWIKARWVKKKRGLVWVHGQWKKVPKGWVWVEGHWRRG